MSDFIDLPHLPECLLGLPLETIHEIHSHTYHAIKADRQQHENEWKLAIDHELVTMQSTADSYSTAQEAVGALIGWHVAVATDPVVSGQQRGEPAAWPKLTSEMVECGAVRRCEMGECESIQDVYDLFRRQWSRALSKAPQPTEPVNLDRYDAGLLGGQDGMPAYVWHDIIRSELDRAYDFYMDQIERAAPQHAAQQDFQRGFDCGKSYGEMPTTKTMEPVGYARKDQLNKVQRGWSHMCQIQPEPQQGTVAIYTDPQPVAQSGHLQKGDRRIIDGKDWVCTDPDIDRWVCNAPAQEPSDSEIMWEWAKTPNSGDMRVDLSVFARALLARYGAAQPAHTLGVSKEEYTRVFNMGRDSAQPSVPECPYPCGWKNLHHMAVHDGAYLAKSLEVGQLLTDNQRATAIVTSIRLIEVCRAMLAAAPKFGEEE